MTCWRTTEPQSFSTKITFRWIIVAVTLLILISVIGFFTYRCYKNRKIDYRLGNGVEGFLSFNSDYGKYKMEFIMSNKYFWIFFICSLNSLYWKWSKVKWWWRNWCEVKDLKMCCNRIAFNTKSVATRRDSTNISFQLHFLISFEIN